MILLRCLVLLKYILCSRSSCESNNLHGLAVVNYEGPQNVKENRAYKSENDRDKKDNKLIRHFDTSLCPTEIGKVCLGDVKSLGKMPDELRKEDVDRKIFLEIDYKYGERETDYGK